MIKNKNDIQSLNDEVTQLKKTIAALKAEFDGALKNLGSQMNGIGNLDFDEILRGLEDKITENKGLNFGPRWRLRFKDDDNKDLFLQDRKSKGYYRFRTTKCNRVVQGVKCGPQTCCDEA